jgi:hypothetical protein
MFANFDDCFPKNPRHPEFQMFLYHPILQTHTMLILIVTLSAFLLVRAYPLLAEYLTAATRR